VADEQGILDAVRAEPDSDVPRLVYADWLEEHGGAPERARGELIRLQIDLARDREELPGRREKAFRARVLLDEYRERWLGQLRRLGVHEADFARGFVERVSVTLEDLDRHAEAIFAAGPLRRLWVLDVCGHAKEIRVPPNNRLTCLDLRGDMIDDGSLQSLLRLPNLDALRALDLQFNDLNDEAVRLLCEAPFFQRLSEIRCGCNPLTEDARQTLRERFGPRVSFDAERDEGHFYCIQNEDYLFTAGFGRNDVQVLFYGHDSELRLILFDHEGNFLLTQERGYWEPDRPAGDWQELSTEVRARWLKERTEAYAAERDRWLAAIDFRPATIRVKRFRLDDGGGIYDYPDTFAEVLNAPVHPDRADTEEWVEQWLAEGKFVYNFGDEDCWFNGAGEVTDT
jgi:uncharacterized protein (TIGR02996 family)